MVGSVSTCNTRLEGDLDEVVSFIDFISHSFRIKAASGDILGWVSGQSELRNTVVAFRNATVTTEIDGIYQWLYIQTWSAFEAFLRASIISYIEDVCAKSADFNSLKQKNLIDRNFYYTGKAFEQVFENRSNVNIDFFAFARNVATAVPESVKVNLNSMAFGFFLKGPSTKGIEDALKRVGIQNFNWDSAGNDASVQSALATSGVRETTKELHRFLKEAEGKRNNIVHRGEFIQPISETELRQGVDVFRALGGFLAGFLISST